MRIFITPEAKKALEVIYASEFRGEKEQEIVESLLYHLARGFEFNISVTNGEITIRNGWNK